MFLGDESVIPQIRTGWIWWHTTFQTHNGVGMMRRQVDRHILIEKYSLSLSRNPIIWKWKIELGLCCVYIRVFCFVKFWGMTRWNSVMKGTLTFVLLNLFNMYCFPTFSWRRIFHFFRFYCCCFKVDKSFWKNLCFTMLTEKWKFAETCRVLTSAVIWILL